MGRLAFLSLLVLLVVPAPIFPQQPTPDLVRPGAIPRQFKPGQTTAGDTTFSNVPQRAIEQKPLAPVTALLAQDHPNDNGHAINLSWVPSIDDNPPASRIKEYSILRLSGTGTPSPLATVPAGTSSYVDRTVVPDSSYRYQIMALAERQGALSALTEAVRPVTNPFRTDRLSLLLVGLLAAAALAFFMLRAKRGEKLFIRKVAGLEAVEEAIGRATEMGRPILFVPGTLDLNEVETLAALTILGQVTIRIAECESTLYMPVSRSLVMTAARDVVKGAYAEAGRADRYSDEYVQYLTDEQFGYVAGIDGYMVRHRPATIFLLGAFYGEALVLAEMGNSVGAIQIAGTARPLQLPFFIAACDYTLIGEELFAASAYLSQEPKQLASLKAQDLLKLAAMLLIGAGALAATAATALGQKSWAGQLHEQLMAFLTVS